MSNRLFYCTDCSDFHARRPDGRCVMCGGARIIENAPGCICQNQHRRGYCTEPGCPYGLRNGGAQTLSRDNLTTKGE
jgi:hypothetical protein